MSRYANKITAGTIGTIVREDGALLMIQRRKEPFAGKWCMPGGKLEVGEHPSAAMIREYYEETGLRVAVERFCGVVSEVVPSSQGDSHFLLYLYRLRHVDGTIHEHGTEEGPLQWFTLSELNGLAVPSDLWMIAHMLLPANGPKLAELISTEHESTIIALY